FNCTIATTYSQHIFTCKQLSYKIMRNAYEKQILTSITHKNYYIDIRVLSLFYYSQNSNNLAKELNAI
ncbi:MAG: hypothetical protein RSB11_08275, partial [Oscillospiraceae bacterium]